MKNSQKLSQFELQDWSLVKGHGLSQEDCLKDKFLF